MTLTEWLKANVPTVDPVNYKDSMEYLLAMRFASALWNGAIESAIETAQNISVQQRREPIQETLSRQKMAILDELRKLKDAGI